MYTLNDMKDGSVELLVMLCTGAVFHIEAAPMNFGAEEIELTILKAHAGLS